MCPQTRHKSRFRGFARLPLIWLIGCMTAGGALLAKGMTGSPPPRTFSTKAIQDVKVGDYVLAKDPNEAGPPTPHRVTALPRNWTEHVVHIEIAGGGEVQATREHPMWVEGKGWTPAKDLKPGDRLRDNAGRGVRIERTRIESRVTGTYNLTVEGVHTFYVLAGSMPVLVHNSMIPDPALAPITNPSQLLPSPSTAMSAVNIGGEGEVPGVLNVQPFSAWGGGWGSAGSPGVPPGLSISSLEGQGASFLGTTRLPDCRWRTIQ